MRKTTRMASNMPRGINRWSGRITVRKALHRPAPSDPSCAREHGVREHDTVELARPVGLDWLVLEKAGGDRLMKPAGRLGEVPEIHKHALAPEAGQQALERSILRRLQSDYRAAHGVPCLSLVSGKSNCVHLPAKRLKRYVAHRLDASIEVDVDRGRFMQRVEGGGPYDDSPSPVSIVRQPDQVISHAPITRVYVCRRGLSA